MNLILQHHSSYCKNVPRTPHPSDTVRNSAKATKSCLSKDDVAMLDQELHS